MSTEVLAPQEEHIDNPHAIAIFGDDRLAALNQMEAFVTVIASRCKGNQFVVSIEGRKYAKVEWWTAVGNSLGILPRTDSIEVLDSGGIMKRRAWVSLWHDGHPMGPKASGVCSSNEILKKKDGTLKDRWLDARGNPIEYAIESMAMTRATGKAFRQSMSILPVLAGLQPTPAEEMDSGQFSNSSAKPEDFNRDALLGFGKHTNLAWKDVPTGYLEWVAADEKGKGGINVTFASKELAHRAEGQTGEQDVRGQWLERITAAKASVSPLGWQHVLDIFLEQTGDKTYEEATVDQLNMFRQMLVDQYRKEQEAPQEESARLTPKQKAANELRILADHPQLTEKEQTEILQGLDEQKWTAKQIGGNILIVNELIEKREEEAQKDIPF